MRMDKRLDRLTVTPGQRYFLSCWFNMVHEFSLDAFRVRVMNPFTTLREIQQAIHLTEAKPDEKVMIFEEAEQLLSADLLLSDPPFFQATQHLLSLLQGDKMKLGADKGGPNVRMLQYLIEELFPTLERDYVTCAFAELKATLDPAITLSDKAHFKKIHSFTGSLLSALLDRDFPLESLYQIYFQVLTQRTSDAYNFTHKFDLATRLLTTSKSKYNVSFALDLATHPEELPTTLGALLISEKLPFGLAPKHSNNSFLVPNSRRRFVTVNEVEALDVRAAGRIAFDRITNLVDLLRFEYEHAPLKISNLFAIRASQSTAGGRIYPIPQVVPNPALTLNVNDVTTFVDSVNELIEGKKLGQEAMDRIVSSFRLYRQGRDQEALETKLTHWWTALEYLVRGNQAGSGIGKSVETSVAPVIGLSYVPKMLIAIRNLLASIGLDLFDESGRNLAKSTNKLELWKSFRDGDIQRKINAALAKDYFLCEQVQLFFDDISDAKKLHTRLIKHEKRVRWQLQRLWRARCDIVHSAGKEANHLLLCSNLEYYLKTSLNGLLSTLRSVPTLSGPHEYFDRQLYKYETMIKALNNGSVDIAAASLD